MPAYVGLGSGAGSQQQVCSTIPRRSQIPILKQLYSRYKVAELNNAGPCDS